MNSSQVETESDRLVERVPQELLDQWRSASVYYCRLIIGAIGFVFLPIGIASIWLPFHDVARSTQLIAVGLGTVFCCATWSLTIYAIGLLAKATWTPYWIPIVECCDGVVTVKWRKETITARVDECGIRSGKVREMKYAARKAKSLILTCDQTMILIDLPPLYRDVFGCSRSYTTVAVGYTEESRRRWRAALGC